MSARRFALTAIAMIMPSLSAEAQIPGDDSRRASRNDSLDLGALQDSAVLRDPRGRELALLAAQSRLRQQNLTAERRPTLSLQGQAQYQSDVARIPVTLPGGVKVPTPPHDTYDGHVAADQRIYDPSIAPRRAVEDAQLAESQARLRAALFPVRQNVSDLYFVALRAQSQLAELETAITDLEAQLRVARARVREGTALPSEEKTIRAELLKRRQAVAELSASRRASLVVLADLTGQSLDSVTILRTPDLAVEVAQARQAIAELRQRPEYEQFARSRAVLEQQERAIAVRDRPRLSAFGRAGYGRPGLNPLSDKFDSYWLTGLQVQWSRWTWGTTRREKELLALQRQIISAEEQQFTDNLRRATEQDLATIDRLAVTIAQDDEIIALREDIAAETRSRFNEGVVTSAEYVDRQTDVLSARVARALHRAELAQARARFLNTLGIEVP
jgi:outer membrane protein TolC